MRKDFYKQFFSIFIVLVLQNIVTLSVNLADNMMLGGYSEMALSGAAAVNQVQFIYQQILMAVGDGMVIVGSQYWGRKQTKPMKKIAATAMRYGMVVCGFLFVLTGLVPGQILRIFTSDAAIIGEGTRYLRLIRYTYPFFAVTQVLLATMRSVEIVRIAFYLSIQSFFVNCGINYILIYGNFGAPEMGIAGAAIGTLTARILECAEVLWYVFVKETRLRMKPGDYLHTDRELSRDYRRIVTPLLIGQGSWGLNTAMQTVVLGHMTAAAIAANSVAATLFLMVKSAAVGASSTASIVIGKAIGRGDLKRVQTDAVTMQKLFLTIGMISGALLFILRIPILNCYNLSDETRQMANTFLIILSVVYIGMSYQMPVNSGIIRGGGSASFVVKMDMISIWCIVIPLSFFMAFVVKASPAVVVCCLNADQIFKCVPAYIKVNHGNWIKKLTRDEHVRVE
ncbi:MAG: MATE family efflux transporter [Eubacteriales bacterium]|nr:MATE family efflux transporter [Eubacteriales bacterium]